MSAGNPPPETDARAAAPQVGRRALLRRTVTALLVAAAAYYLYVAVAGNLEQLRQHAWEFDPVRLALSLAAHLAVLAGGVWIWGRVLDHFEHPPVGTGTLMRIWFLSNLARYIPGKIFQFVVAGQLASAAGLTSTVLLTSLVVHTGFSVLAAGVVSAWLVVDTLLPGLPAGLAGVLGTGAALACVHPRLLNAILGLLPRLLKRNVIRWNGSWMDGALLLALGVASWGLYGLAYWLLIGALTEVPAGAIALLTGINAVSFLAGYLALTPAGIGVREFAMTSLLIPLVGGPGVGAVLAIATRLWTVATELLGGGLSLLLTRPAAPRRPAAG